MRFLMFLCVLLAFSAPASAKEVLKGPIPGEVVNVLDGDTVTVRLHVWLGQSIETHVRIHGIDAPEIKGKCESERARAQEAKNEVANLLSSGEVSLYNIQFEKYAGRVMADAVSPTGENVADVMIAKGLARPYGGERRKGWCS